MKTKTYLIVGGALVAALAFTVGRWSSPSQVEDPHAGHDHSSSEESSDPSVWTCSMHPQIQQPEPGDCPICGMDLIPLEKDSGADDGPRVMSMSKSSRALADIQSTAVVRRFPEAEVRLVGKLGYDDTKVKSLTARFPARVDELFVNFTGIKVKKGDHLARVYSPELLTAQSELLTAYRFDPESVATDSAKEKLRLWDLLPEQIEEILASGVAKDHFELKAPIAGVVVHKNVNEGDYVRTGQALFRIVDLDTLWLRLDAYESDLGWLRLGQSVDFTVESYPGESFAGKIVFIEPELDRRTRTVSIRVNIPNEDGKLKPGMFAKAVARSQLALSGNVYAPEYAGKWISPMHPEVVKDGPGSCDVCGMDLVPVEELGYVQDPDVEAPLVIPASAVLRTGKRAVVYVEKPDSERPAFEGREIEIGPRAGDVFIVRAGLSDGERVVTSGAFKIDSALQIQAKPSMMNPQGGGPVPGHDHGGGEVAGHQGSDMAQDLSIDLDTAVSLLPGYLDLQRALASDDFDGALKQLKEMMAVTGHSGDLPDLLHKMLGADSIDGIRTPHFSTLSDALIESVKDDPSALSDDLLIMNCPMALNNVGADWIQVEEPLQNPFFGAMMLKCGELKETIKANAKAGEKHVH